MLDTLHFDNQFTRGLPLNPNTVNFRRHPPGAIVCRVTPNFTRFGTQPQIALWNLAQLGNALMPLVKDTVPLKEALAEYSRSFNIQWQEIMTEKLGFTTFCTPSHVELIAELLELQQQVETDMTIFFRRLALPPILK